MKTLRFRKRVDLDLPFHATYDLVPLTEVKESGTSIFDSIVTAVKKAGFDYEIIQTEHHLLDCSGSFVTEVPKHSGMLNVKGG